MSLLGRKIVEHGNNRSIIKISWDMQESITLDDVAFVSTDTRRFNLDLMFGQSITHIPGYLCINERFNNYENTCLMYLVFNFNKDKTHHYIRNGRGEKLFSEKFLTTAYYYSIKHGMRLLQKIIENLKYEPPRLQRVLAFREWYLNNQ